MKVSLLHYQRTAAILMLWFAGLNFTHAQNFVYHAEFVNSWAGPGYNFVTDINGYPSVTVQATSTDDEFIIESDLYYNKWDNMGTCPINVPTPFIFYGNTPSFDPGNSYLSDSTVIDKYYTTRIQNVGYSSTNVVVMETDAAPVAFATSNAVTQAPLTNAVYDGQFVTVTVKLQNARSQQERVFVRYTDNNYTTSFISEVNFSSLADTIGTAVIQAFNAGTTVNYYVFSSTYNATLAGVNYDLVTLRQANNNGSNYEYTVTNAAITSQVVFRVNMSTQFVAQGVYLAGSFNGFSTTANPMTGIGNNIYVDTLDLDTSASVIYKFVNGSGAGADFETVPGGCGLDDGAGNINRFLEVPNSNATLPVVCFNECTNCIAPTMADVTFRVNMSQQTVSPDGVHLEGTFNNFDPAGLPMTAIGGGVYEAVVALDTTQTIIYKFINGNTFAGEEAVPAACGVANGFGGYDRPLVVPNTTTTLPTICFAECADCVVPTLADVTFMVNMSLQTVSAQGVYLAGSFNGWSATATPMTAIGGGVYQAIVAIDTTTTVQYKFLNGSSFAQQETVPAACGVPNGFGGYDRELSVPGVASVLPTVCFNECADCIIPALVDVTFRVNMSQQTVSPNGVHLEGSFNGFSLTANPMTDIGGGVYEATVALDTTTTVIYKFNNGNNYTTEEVVPGSCGVPNTFGGFDRQLVVPNNVTTLPTVCFGQCVNCPVPVPVAVTFRVNMSQQTVSPNGVHLAGTFNGWSLSANPMTLIGGGVYETIVQLDTTAIVQYKFINGDSINGYEVVPAACGNVGGGGVMNRQYTVPETASVIPTVCFGQCTDCVAPVLVNVTFRVNMSQQTISPDGVFLAGTFNGFSSSAAQMTSLGGGIFTYSMDLDTSLTIQYKFVNGTGVSAVYETVPGACGQVGGGGVINRQFDIPGTDVTLPLVCFNECADCILPVTVDITFRLNLSGYPISGNGIHLAGSFNAFSTTASPMTNVSGTIYEATVQLTAGTNVTYKYLNGNTSFDFENVPSACGTPDGFGGYNRTLNVPSATGPLSTVCFSSCVDCVPVSIAENATNEINVYPNPANDVLYISLSNVPVNGMIQMFDLNGREILNSKTMKALETIDMSQFAKGVYTLRYTTNDKVTIIKVLKQ